MDHANVKLLQWTACITEEGVQGMFIAETPFGTVRVLEGTKENSWQASLQLPWQVAATSAGNSVSAAMQQAQQAVQGYVSRNKDCPLHWTKLAYTAPGLQNLKARADTPFGFVDISCKRNHLTEADEYKIDFWNTTVDCPDALDLQQAQAIATRIYVELIAKEADKLGLLPEQALTSD